MIRTRFRNLAFLLVASVFATSCGNQPEGYGVVLWSQSEDDLRTGSIIPISDTRSEETYVYSLDDETSREIVTWRVQFFDELEAAERYQEEYARYADLYARANMNALPVRELQERRSATVYRLRAGEIMKVVEKSDEVSDEGGLVAHWYLVLTREGVTGYVFGHHLTVYDQTVGIVEKEPEVDPVLASFVSQTWRPIYFSEMIDTGTFDLDLFKPNIGLFPDPENNTLRLVLPDYSETFVYEEIVSVAQREYMAVGTSLQIIVRSDRVAALQYTREGRTASIGLEVIEQNIAEVIVEERERRQELYAGFYEMGILKSSAYGTIEFYEDVTFEWRDYSRLVPNVVPANAEDTGVVAFDTYAGPATADRFDGVITFYFDGARNVPVRFLYQDSVSGVRMRYVPQSDLEDNVVIRASLSPVVIFFSRPGQT